MHARFDLLLQEKVTKLENIARAALKRAAANIWLPQACPHLQDCPDDKFNYISSAAGDVNQVDGLRKALKVTGSGRGLHNLS